MNGHNGSTGNPYDPRQHLVTIQTSNGPKEHYPFDWQLHEFRLRYPAGLLDVELLQVDIERDCVIVKVTALESDLGNGKGVGLQTGRVAHLGTLLEYAKAQALKDMGVGCSWPIAFASDLAKSAPVQASASPRTQEPQAQPPQGSEQQPGLTVETVKAFFAQVYRVKPEQVEVRWHQFLVNVFGKPLTDGELTDRHFSKLHGILSQQFQKTNGAPQPVASLNGAGRK